MGFFSKNKMKKDSVNLENLNRNISSDTNGTSRKIFFESENKLKMIITELFRGLRTNLYFINEKLKTQIVVFTSSIPKEGKTTIAANYAMSNAVNGRKTLIIDCDVKRPRVNNIFGIKKVFKGLVDYLQKDENLSEIIIRRYENLDVLPTSNLKRNTTELFHTLKFKKMLEQLKKKYDCIIIDTPPVGVASEAGIISRYASGVVVVCGYNMVNKKQLHYTKRHLSNAGAKVLGVVINKIDKSGYSYGAYSYYNNYSEYYDNYV